MLKNNTTHLRKPSPKEKTGVQRTSCQRIGDAGEEIAARTLQKSGFTIIARNWRHHQLEIDLVCRDQGVLVFVEVKTRGAKSILLPSEAITLRKRSALIRAAYAWLNKYDCWDAICRFDVVCVTRHADTFTVEHIPNAFDISSLMDGRHATWQPW